MKAYIKVKCSDELPGKSDEYQTNVGLIEYKEDIQEFGYLSEPIEQERYDDRYTEWIVVPVAYWLKEVTIPDDEEIKIAIIEWCETQLDCSASNGFRAGINWLLSKLK